MRLTPRHPGLLILAVILAFSMWYVRALERRERVSERQLEASLTFVNVPNDMVITSETPRSLLIRVRGTLRRLMNLEPTQVGVILDLRGIDEGLHELAVESSHVMVPSAVDVLTVTPAQIPVHLEKLVRRQVPILPRLAGQPAEHWTVGEVTCEPSLATVMGPRGQVDALQAVATDPVSLDGAESAVVAVVSVRSPHPLTRIEAPLTVRVVVALMDQTAERPEGRQR